MFDHYTSNNVSIKLYRKNEKGEVLLLEVKRDNFSSSQDFLDAQDEYFAMGFTDDREEAKAQPIPS